MEADYLSWRSLVLEWHLLSCIAQEAFELRGQLGVDLLASTHTNQCQHYYTLENLLPLEALEFNAFNHPLTYQVSYVFPHPTLVPLVLSKFLAEHVTGQFRPLILVAPCWREASWLPTVPSMLVDIPCCCPIVKHLVIDVSIDWVLKGLPSLYLTLCCPEMCVVQT